LAEITIEQRSEEIAAPEISEKSGPHPANKSAHRRLKIIEGQVKGIQKMIEDEKYCIDILTQISATRAALDGVGKVILRRHLDKCVSDAFRNDDVKIKEILDELMVIFAKEEF
jgi:DNA-binding FrmR family transcriptional regulator